MESNGLDLKTQELFKQTLEQMYEGLQILSFDWTYLYVNKAACIHGQKSKEELLGKKIIDLYPDIEKTDLFKRMSRCMKERVNIQIENEFQYANGTKRWFDLYIDPHQQGILVRSIDITDRKILQEQFWHSQKLDAIGRLAGNLAHDLHNKFSIMALNCDSLILKHQDTQLQKSLKSIVKAIKESSSMTRQLLAFSRKQVLDLKVVNLNTLMDEFQKTLPQLMGESIDVKFHLKENIKNTYLDPAQFEQVLLNICNNARDAMPNGGILTIETSQVDLDTAYAKTHSEVTPGPHVLLAISDTGLGMSTDILKQAFEPFFTTKSRGRGTGLGLSAVQGIVKQCGGHIWVYSEPDVGTTIKIYFPAVVEEVNARSFDTIETRADTLKGHEKILFVEDDADLNEIFTSILQDAGYDVIGFQTPKSAMEVFLKNPDTFDILLTDVSLPGFSGKILYEKLRALKPDLKVIYLSGYTENSIIHNGVLDTESILIQKPVSRSILLSVLREVLDGKVFKGVF